MDCESCGAEIPAEVRDESKCLGCGLWVCQSCVDVFDHIGDGLHEKGDPAKAVESLKAENEWLKNVAESRASAVAQLTTTSDTLRDRAEKAERERDEVRIEHMATIGDARALEYERDEARAENATLTRALKAAGSPTKYYVAEYTFKGDRIAWGYRLVPWDQAKPHGPYRTKKLAIDAARAATRVEGEDE